MKLGFGNAADTSHCAMNVIQSIVQWKFVLVYLDDVVIFPKSLDPFINQMKHVLTLVHSTGLIRKLKEC